MGICIQDNLNIRKLNYKTFCELIVAQCVKLSNIGKVKEDVLEGSTHKFEALDAWNGTISYTTLWRNLQPEIV